jgi:hypothetical protein
MDMRFFLAFLMVLSLGGCGLGPPKWREDGNYHGTTTTCYTRTNEYAPSHMPDTVTYCDGNDNDNDND